MVKRITSKRVKKYGIIVGAIGVPTAILMIALLVNLGAINITGYSGDSICKGTLDDPCNAYINFTANEDIFIYPGNWTNTAFFTDVQPKSVKMYRSWGKGWREIKLNQSCTGTWCGLSNSKDVRKFSFAFREGRDYKIRYEVLKYNPEDSIKWGFDSVDPIFYGFEVTNKIEYSNNDLNIKIKDALNKEVANVKLISHKNVYLPRYVMPGKNRKVMIYEIENFEDYADAIKGIEILNKNTGQLENKQYHLEYAVYDYVTKPIYSSNCINVIAINGTKYEDCEQVVNGSYENYEIVEWKTLYSKNLLKGNLTIALVTDVNQGDYYDGVLTLFGKKLDKHATWVDSYNTDLLAYFTMDDNSENSVSAKYDGFDTGITYGAGKIANGSKFSGLSSRINISDDADFYFGTGEWTVNFWVNSTSPADEGFVGTYHYVDDGWMIYTDVGSQLRFRNGGDLSFASGYAIPGDTWVMITMTRNATHWSFYVNGDLKAMNVAGLGLATNNENLTWGGVETNSVKSLTGSLDEAFFANRSWDASEILDLYNGGSGMTYVPSVSDALPSVTLNSPPDSSTQFNLTISINCSATDDDEIKNVSLHINGVLNKTQAGSGTNFTELTQTYTAPSSGNYNWTCNAYDNASQLSWASSNFTVTIALNISGTLKYNNLTSVVGGDILITDQATNLLIKNITTNSTGGWTYNVSSGMYLIQSYYPSTNASDPNLESPDAESHVVVP